MNIPVVHLAGGDLTEGAIDDSFRHAITKMSNLHFTGTEQYRKRIIQMGEQPDRVHAYGQTSLDNILNEPRIPQAALESDIEFQFGERSLLVTYHPATREIVLSPAQQIEQVLASLDRFPTVNLLFTAANADPGGQEINQLIAGYVRRTAPRCALVQSLGRRRYASAMAYVDAVVGNSSSGLTETPSFGIGAVNIGDRQKGRLMADNVVNCRCEAAEIAAAIERVLSSQFRSRAARVTNPFGDGHAAERIVTALLQTDFSTLLQKKFHDVDFALNPEGVLTLKTGPLSQA
jgi:UDP-hydrolysing UDP-N-acetyl-D-glucosamine 2-epimerase